jgi:glycosyltransferase involved in cell wall biosynthesis
MANQTTEEERLKVAHVVTYCSVDGAYGGPVAVARNQISELARRGHLVELLAGWDGRADLQLAGVRISFFRAYSLYRRLRFATMLAPRLLFYLARRVKHLDALHVHLARDLVTVPAALIGIASGTPTYVQTHGMIRPDKRPAARALDFAVRFIFRRSVAHFVLTDEEESQVTAIEPRRANLVHLANGISTSSASPQWHEPPTVLFCSRLHPRKRVMAFVAMAEELLAGGANMRFVIHGPDGGGLEALTSRLRASEFSEFITYGGSLDSDGVQDVIQESQLLVLPSVREPYPMIVLEAMAVGCPAVITSSNGLAPIVNQELPELVCDESISSLAPAVRHVFQIEVVWKDYSRRSQRLVSESFGIASVVDRLLGMYARTEAQSGI